MELTIALVFAFAAFVVLSASFADMSVQEYVQSILR